MISVAVQKGDTIYVYNERNQTIFVKHGQLVGYTASTVSVRVGNSTYTYSEKGQTISVH